MPKSKTRRSIASRCARRSLAAGSAKPWPAHKAREVRNIFNGKFTAWSIYPDQLPAMIKAMGDVIYDDVLTSGDAPANCAQKALAAIGVVLPNT